MASLKSEISMSVVIPVYNKADRLEECVESVLGQTANKASFEIILVDDGSTDGSLSLCRNMAERHSCIRLISQTNQGVSAARNAGMKAAVGRYIMFLDADDLISPGTIQSLVSVFEKCEQDTDLITYPLQYFNPYTGSRKSHKRETWFDGDGVYDLEKYPYVAQTTMNVCIRNEQDPDAVFAYGMKMGEDQLFITERLKGKAKIGYCSKAEYIYTKDGSNASRQGNNPLYAFDDMITLYQSLLDIAQENPAMKEYAYQLILYNIDWRLRGDLLFPTFCTGDERSGKEQQLASILKRIPMLSYARSPYLSEYHKGYLLNRYILSKEEVSVSYGCERTTVSINKKYWETDKPKITITHCLESAGHLLMRGHFDCPAFILDSQPILFLCFGEKRVEVLLDSSSFEYNEAKVKTAKSYNFAIEIPTEPDRHSISYWFIAEVSRRPIERIDVALTLKRHNAFVVDGTALFRKCMLQVSGDNLIIHRKRIASTALLFAKKAMEDRSFLVKRLLVSMLMMRRRKQRVWLYVDLPASPTKGNALIQFLHDIEKDDGIERYYISNCGEQLEKEHPVLLGHVVKCETVEHVFLSLKAEIIFASYVESFTYRPMSQSTYDGLGDYAGKQELIYLQHGVLHARMPWYISYDRLLFDKIVISTQLEATNLTHRYCFPDSSIIYSGMPRFDMISVENIRPKKKILFAPSWRAYLVAGKASRRTAVDDLLISSSFYRGVKTFVSRLIEERLLEKWGFSLEIKLHPNFSCYKHLFVFDNDNVSLSSEQILESDYAVVITDYSSYAYDFVYAGCDILYFIPDYKEFKAGLNQYSELDFSLDKNEGFGPLSTNAEDAITELALVLSRTENDDIDQTVYQKRCQKFFFHHDGKNSDRLYEASQALANEKDSGSFYQEVK